MTMTTHPLALTALFALVAASTACDDNNASVPYCEDVETTVLSLDDETPAGITPGEVLGLIEGERQMPLDYADAPAGGVEVSIDPGGEGSTDLTLDLQPLGEVRWIETEEVYPPGGIQAAIAVECNDRLEIDAELGFASNDGVFDEIFAVTVRAELDEYAGDELRWATINHAFEPDELDGDFNVVSVTPEDPTRVDYNLDLRYPLGADDEQLGQPRGTIGGGAEYDQGDTAVWGRFVIASFGDVEGD